MISGLIVIACGMILIVIAVIGKARDWWDDDVLVSGGIAGAFFVFFGFIAATSCEEQQVKARLHIEEKDSK